MRKGLVLSLLLLPMLLNAAEQSDGDAPKELSGMSLIGNNETPKSLYIVPWKSSEIASETKLTSNLLNEEMTPVDKGVFMREIDFYQISTAK